LHFLFMVLHRSKGDSKLPTEREKLRKGKKKSKKSRALNTVAIKARDIGWVHSQSAC